MRVGRFVYFGIILALLAVATTTIFGFSPRRIGKFLIGYSTNENEQITNSLFVKSAPCPAPGPRTLVLVPMGQSNAGNSITEVRFDLKDPRIVAFYGGSCSVAKDPLLGNGGIYGSFWSPLASHLLSSGRWDAIVIAAMAVGGSEIARWSSGGDLVSMAKSRFRDLKTAGYNDLNVLWQQGEQDRGGDPAAYGKKLSDVIGLIRSQAADARIFIAQASFCEGAPDANIVAVQAAAIDPAHQIYPGPDTDQFGSDFRADGCHFNARGAAAEVLAWSKALDGHLR